MSESTPNGNNGISVRGWWCMWSNDDDSSDNSGDGVVRC